MSRQRRLQQLRDAAPLLRRNRTPQLLRRPLPRLRLQSQLPPLPWRSARRRRPPPLRRGRPLPQLRLLRWSPRLRMLRRRRRPCRLPQQQPLLLRHRMPQVLHLLPPRPLLRLRLLRPRREGSRHSPWLHRLLLRQLRTRRRLPDRLLRRRRCSLRPLWHRRSSGSSSRRPRPARRSRRQRQRQLLRARRRLLRRRPSRPLRLW